MPKRHHRSHLTPVEAAAYFNGLYPRTLAEARTILSYPEDALLNADNKAGLCEIYNELNYLLNISKQAEDIVEKEIKQVQLIKAANQMFCIIEWPEVFFMDPDEIFFENYAPAIEAAESLNLASTTTIALREHHTRLRHLHDFCISVQKTEREIPTETIARLNQVHKTIREEFLKRIYNFHHTIYQEHNALMTAWLSIIDGIEAIRSSTNIVEAMQDIQICEDSIVLAQKKRERYEQILTKIPVIHEAMRQIELIYCMSISTYDHDEIYTVHVLENGRLTPEKIKEKQNNLSCLRNQIIARQCQLIEFRKVLSDVPKITIAVKDAIKNLDHHIALLETQEELNEGLSDMCPNETGRDDDTQEGIFKPEGNTTSRDFSTTQQRAEFVSTVNLDSVSPAETPANEKLSRQNYTPVAHSSRIAPSDRMGPRNIKISSLSECSFKFGGNGRKRKNATEQSGVPLPPRTLPPRKRLKMDGNSDSSRVESNADIKEISSLFSFSSSFKK